MNDTTNITHTALKAVIHRIVQQHPSDMQHMENIVEEIENQYGVPLSLDWCCDVAENTSNMQQLENIVEEIENQDDEPLSRDVYRSSAEHPSNTSEDQNPYATQEALDWLAGIAYQAQLLQAAADEIMWAIIRHRDNHKNVIGRTVLDQASDTISACLHLHQMLEDTIDRNES